jgi:hypothetical protein
MNQPDVMLMQDLVLPKMLVSGQRLTATHAGLAPVARLRRLAFMAIGHGWGLI